MWAYKEKLYMYRTLSDLDSVWDRYVKARKKKLSIAIHFRKATAGTILFENVHPFEIRPGFGFMHNGTVKDLVPYTPKGISDTNFINTEIFQNFPKGFLQNPAHRVVATSMLDGGRMLFMDSHENFSILNEGRWGAQWVDGVWYSKGEHLAYYQHGKKELYTSLSWERELYDKYDIDYSSDTGYGYWREAPAKKPEHTKIIPFYPTKKEAQEIKIETKKERKQRRKMLIRKAKQQERIRISPVLGPPPSQSANLIFDYGYFSFIAHYEQRLKAIGLATIKDYQLWALGDLGGEMPGAIPVTNSKITGTLYEITSDYKDVIESFDDIYGCDVSQPDISVFYRRWVKVNLHEGIKRREVWVWFYHFAMRLADVPTSAIVPMGDWSRWASPIYPIKEA